MQLFDFISAEQIDELSEDNRIAFCDFVEICRKSLDAHLEHAQNAPTDELAYELTNDVKLTFMNIVTGAAKDFEIAGFSEYAIPSVSDFNGRHFDQFSAELNHFTTQLVLSNRRRKRLDSVEITSDAKDRIRTYVASIRNCIEESSASDSLKSDLLEKLNNFDDALNNRRLSFKTVMVFAMAIFSLPPAALGNADIVAKLTTNIMQVVAVEKATEDQQRQPLLPEQSPALTLPSRPTVTPPFDSGSDDDIPF